ncbi:HK97-gp10 family putative phage morphogenesis protein [Enterococcus sp. AZ102]|uniref:HK97-gp10 family putative phage morphogenesis protein n=1 Tax=Enterococcus sp. AZ102 TaxID=2774865 RepID=UPI003F20823E
MTDGIEVDFNDLKKYFVDLGNKFNKVEKLAIEKGAEVAKEKLREKTPLYNRGGKIVYSYYTPSSEKGKTRKERKTVARYKKEHAKNNIVVEKVKDGHTFVGFNGEASWYVHFVEFGTFKINPKPFVQETERDSKQEIYKMMGEVLRKELLKK